MIADISCVSMILVPDVLIIDRVYIYQGLRVASGDARMTVISSAATLWLQSVTYPPLMLKRGTGRKPCLRISSKPSPWR